MRMMRLSTGREILVVSERLSLDNDGVVGTGVDNELYGLTDSDGDDDDSPPLTSEERKELAQIVIDRWRKWAGL